MYNKIMDVINKYEKVAILGFGKEGKSTYNYIRKHNPNKLLYILDGNKDLSLELLKEDKNVKIVLGENYLNNLEEYDYIIKSPGVKLTDDIYDKIEDKLSTQIKLTMEFYRDNIIGITGTKGKSTTSSLLYKVIKDQKDDCLLL